VFAVTPYPTLGCPPRPGSASGRNRRPNTFSTFQSACRDGPRIYPVVVVSLAQRSGSSAPDCPGARSWRNPSAASQFITSGSLSCQGSGNAENFLRDHERIVDVVWTPDGWRLMAITRYYGPLARSRVLLLNVPATLRRRQSVNCRHAGAAYRPRCCLARRWPIRQGAGSRWSPVPPWRLADLLNLCILELKLGGVSPTPPASGKHSLRPLRHLQLDARVGTRVVSVRDQPRCLREAALSAPS
jgi:hypothetical protein